MEERTRDERHRERWPEGGGGEGGRGGETRERERGGRERERERVGGPNAERLPVILKHILAEWFRCGHRVAIILVQRGL